MSDLPEKTSSDLEWPRVLEAVAARTAGFLGRRAALELRLINGRRFVVTVDEPERFADLLAKP